MKKNEERLSTDFNPKEQKTEKKYVVKDSGAREVFSTGAVRDTANGKTRIDLISPFFLEALGNQLRRGAEKYTAWNWARGIPSSRCFESAMRHLNAYAQGLDDEDHLAAAAFNIMAIIHNRETSGAFEFNENRAGINDMPIFKKNIQPKEVGK